jgi:hypothetical protein
LPVPVVTSARGAASAETWSTNPDEHLLDPFGMKAVLPVAEVDDPDVAFAIERGHGASSPESGDCA